MFAENHVEGGVALAAPLRGQTVEVYGSVEPGFEPVREAFAENFEGSVRQCLQRAVDVVVIKRLV